MLTQQQIAWNTSVPPLPGRDSMPGVVNRGRISLLPTICIDVAVGAGNCLKRGNSTRAGITRCLLLGGRAE